MLFMRCRVNEEDTGLWRRDQVARELEDSTSIIG